MDAIDPIDALQAEVMRTLAHPRRLQIIHLLAAGPQDVYVAGGPEIARQYLNAGLVDEVRLNLAPMFLGGGTSLFEGVSPEVRLVPREASVEPLAAHLVYDVQKER